MGPLLVWLAAAGPAWATVGALLLPLRYRRLALDPRLARLSGGLAGFALGPLGVGWLYLATPRLGRGLHVALPALLAAGELVALFAVAEPANPCVTSPGYVANQIQSGLEIGMVYATIGVGLSLIFSVLGIVSFAHGQFVMLGGVVAYQLLTTVWHTNPLVVLPIVAAMAFIVGGIVERLLLSPMHRGRVERPDEYGLLITFGLGLFLQYAALGMLGPTSGLKAPGYTVHPIFGLNQPSVVAGPLTINMDYVFAGAVGIVACAALTVFLRATWLGRSLRAVAMNPQAATIAGIDSGRTFTLAFAIGTALAGLAGAALVPALNFPLPDIATQSALRAYVIIVLGGLGSVPGAFLGGLVIGVVEALGAGCYPDPSKGATYQTAFGLVIFAAVLLLRPQGLFGRKRS